MCPAPTGLLWTGYLTEKLDAKIQMKYVESKN